MKPDHSASRRPDDALDSEVSELLDKSTANLPASITSRLQTARSISLDRLANRAGGSAERFDWRPACAALTLCLLAVILLYVPDRQEPYYAESWPGQDEYLLGDDLSLYLWLSESQNLSISGDQ